MTLCYKILAFRDGRRWEVNECDTRQKATAELLRCRTVNDGTRYEMFRLVLVHGSP